MHLSSLPNSILFPFFFFADGRGRGFFLFKSVVALPPLRQGHGFLRPLAILET
jgi:hypothetical protein